MVDAVLDVVEAVDTPAFAVAISRPGELAVSEPADRVSLALAPGWLKALPRPTLQGYRLHPASAVKRVPVEIGAPRVYRQSREPMTEVGVAWQMDAWQQMLFDGFQRSVLAEGERWFGVMLAFPIGLELAVSRFKGDLAMHALGGGRWRVTGMLELRQRPAMSEADLSALLDDEGEDPAWPMALLPRPLTDSWSLQPKPALARSEDLAGLLQQRQRSQNSTMEVDADWELSADQAALFDGFFRWRGRDGGQWFGFPLYQGIGTVVTEVRFIGDADWTPRAGGRWAVSAPIEIRERQVISVAELALLQGEDWAALFAVIQELHQVIDDIEGEGA